MRPEIGLAAFAAVIGISAAAATAISEGPRGSTQTQRHEWVSGQTKENQMPDYSGMWVTADRRIRHELLPNGRYDEARGERESAYQGRYWITGDHIEYVDDTGFSADGDFIDGVLHHAGMILRREPSGSQREPSTPVKGTGSWQVEP